MYIYVCLSNILYADYKKHLKQITICHIHQVVHVFVGYIYKDRKIGTFFTLASFEDQQLRLKGSYRFFKMAPPQ